MKTSNKILLSLIIIPVLFVAAIPITLHWKLAHGDHTIVNPDDNFDYKQFAFTKVNYVVLDEIDCVILPSDSLKLDVESTSTNFLDIHQHHDTLVIRLRETPPSPKTRLYLPPLQNITASDSRILLRGQLKAGDARSYVFYLNNTSLRTSNASSESRITQFFDSVFVTGSNATIDLSGGLEMKKLSITDVENVRRSPSVSIGEMVFVYNKKSQVKSTGKDGVIQIVAK